ncbi:unnamed protein product [Cunninghamella blakesleeana]
MDITLDFEPFDCSFQHWTVENTKTSIPTSPTTLINKEDSTTTVIEETEYNQFKQKQTIKLLHAIEELLQTERDYNAHLTYLVQVCFNKVLQQQQWISDQHKNILIRNSTKLLSFHQQFLIKLEEANLENDIYLRCKSIATVFLDMGSNFTLYDDYCDKHDDAIHLCKEYRLKPEWSIFTKECTAFINNGYIYPTPESSFDQHHHQWISTTTKPLHFEDYLIKPVQRVCRYQLLLKEILKYTTKETIEYKKLDCAIEMMKAIVAGIDRQKYNRDTIERTQLFIERLDLSETQLSKDTLYQLGNLMIAGAIDVIYSTTSSTSLVSPTTTITTSLGSTSIHSPSSSPSLPSPIGTLVNARSKYLGCFIFSTYLILVRPKKVTTYTPKYWFPLRHVELEDIQDTHDQYENAFLLRYKNHLFIFTATCLREKKLWMKKLNEILMEHQQQPTELVSSLDENDHSNNIRKSSLTKIYPSRSVTNLLDFGRDHSQSANNNTIMHQHPTLNDPISTCDNNNNKVLKKSKSFSSQLANYYQQQQQINEHDHTHHQIRPFTPPSPPPLPHHPHSLPPLPPSPPPSSYPHSPKQPLQQINDEIEDENDSTTLLSSPVTLMKRHSIDSSQNNKKKREQLKSRVHSEMYIKPSIHHHHHDEPLPSPTLPSSTTFNNSSNNNNNNYTNSNYNSNSNNQSSTSYCSRLQRKSGSLDILSSSSSQLSLNMIGKIKNNHQHAMRISFDHKLRDVCTQDYLSSRSWSTLLRESTAATATTPTSTMAMNHSSALNNHDSSSSIQPNKRKSSLSNLRSSASTLSMIMLPTRRISDGSNNSQNNNNNNNNQQQNETFISSSVQPQQPQSSFLMLSSLSSTTLSPSPIISPPIDTSSSLISSTLSTLEENHPSHSHHLLLPLLSEQQPKPTLTSSPSKLNLIRTSTSFYFNRKKENNRKSTPIISTTNTTNPSTSSSVTTSISPSPDLMYSHSDDTHQQSSIPTNPYKLKSSPSRYSLHVQPIKNKFMDKFRHFSLNHHSHRHQNNHVEKGNPLNDEVSHIYELKKNQDMWKKEQQKMKRSSKLSSMWIKTDKSNDNTINTNTNTKLNWTKKFLSTKK